MSVAERLTEIRDRIERACKKAGRKSADVHLLAVSKLQPIELIEEAYAAGQLDFGENYVQELVEKREKLAKLSGIRWHLIGHLQTNKAKAAVECAHLFHALDSIKLANELAKRSEQKSGTKPPFPVFLEINVDAEDAKAGIAPEATLELARQVLALPSLKLEGLMCIPEPQPTPEQMRPAFQRIAQLARQLESELQLGNRLSLSMGMSEDFEVAIEEGANWVRVGRKLFGERKV